MSGNFDLGLPPDVPRRPPVHLPHRGLTPSEVVLALSAGAIGLLLLFQVVLWCLWP
jgi:hypothetical protein